MLRQFGKFVGTMKRMAGDFQRQFNDAIKDTELDDLKNMTSSKGFGPLEDARKSMEEFQNSIGESIDEASEIEAPAVSAEVEAPAVKPKTATKEVKKAAPTKAKSKPTSSTKATTKAASARKAPAKKPATTRSTKSAKISS